MKFSKRTQYGLRAMAYLAEVFGEKKKVCSLREISKQEGISFDYLEKVISRLEKKGLVKAKRGARGGYFLARSPQKISLKEIIKTLEETTAVVECVAQERGRRYKCPRRKICKTFNAWGRIQEALDSVLNSITLWDLIK